MEEKNTVPAAIPPAGTDDNPARKDRRPVVIGVAVAAAVVLAVGGVCAHRAYEGHRVSVARQACQLAVADQSKAMKAYKALLGAGDTTAALKTDVKSVKDAKTVDALKKAAETETPALVGCDASDKAGLDEATAKAGKSVKTVKADAKALESAVKAVESSKLDKTVDDANALYKATDGKVQDAKTRDALKQAIAKRDAGAIAKAVKAVNDSKAAKDKADAEAKAKAEREAAQQAAAAAQAAQQQAQSQRSYTPSYSTGGSGGYSYSRSSGGSTGGSTSSGSTGGSSSGGSGIHSVGIGVEPDGSWHPGNLIQH
ncbi:hypothetical protein [Bifidobacterium ruminantium]|uniref:hypothetical protein n=1 Tax=Bifidobacterium ruminantium TaxID=78346 RepID=UPI0024930E27|nr:hypothetical protein [Bifidobacterium ruminantium]